MSADDFGHEKAVSSPNALIPGNLTRELDVPNNTEWLLDDRRYDLLEIDTGQPCVYVSKLSNRIIRVYVEDVIRERAAIAEISINSTMHRPLTLILNWEISELRLQLADEPPIPLLWQAYPLTPRP